MQVTKYEDMELFEGLLRSYLHRLAAMISLADLESTENCLSKWEYTCVNFRGRYYCTSSGWLVFVNFLLRRHCWTANCTLICRAVGRLSPGHQPPFLARVGEGGARVPGWDPWTQKRDCFFQLLDFLLSTTTALEIFSHLPYKYKFIICTFTWASSD